MAYLEQHTPRGRLNLDDAIHAIKAACPENMDMLTFVAGRLDISPDSISLSQGASHILALDNAALGELEKRGITTPELGSYIKARLTENALADA